MRMNHVETSLTFPTFSRFCGQTFLERSDKELSLACVRAYNDFMVEEWCGDSDGALVPLIIIPLWDGHSCSRRGASERKSWLSRYVFL